MLQVAAREKEKDALFSRIEPNLTDKLPNSVVVL
jgi:hypothetical protein